MRCSSCGRDLAFERVCDSGHDWVVVSCADCAALTRLEIDGDAPTLEATGAVIARLRDRLARARDAGNLDLEARAIHGDPEVGAFLASPHLVRDAVEGLGRPWRIAKMGSFTRPWSRWSESIPDEPWPIDRHDVHLPPEVTKNALRQSDLGGFVMPEQAAYRWGRVIVLPAQRFHLVGLRGRRLVFEVPAFARRRLPDTPSLVGDASLFVPDRSRRV